MPLRPQGLRPGRLREDFGQRTQGDVGVDQRSSAQPTAHQHADLVADAKIEQRGAIADVRLRQLNLRLFCRFQQGVGILARADLASPLQQTDSPPSPGQAAGGNRATVPGTDHHDVVVILHVLHWEDSLVAGDPFAREAGREAGADGRRPYFQAAAGPRSSCASALKRQAT